MRIVLNIVLYLGICNIIISKESFFIESYKENIKETRDTIDLSCINFLDERNKKDSISLSDLGQGELFPSYSGEIKQGFFSVNFIGKTKKERFFWSIYNNKGFFKNNNPYLKNSRDIEKIINKSLPLGIDEEVDQKTYNLEDGDLIIMSSDGVLENLIDNDQLESFIQSSSNLLPQQLVYEILNYTTTHDMKAKDDMTIIVLKIQKQK